MVETDLKLIPTEDLVEELLSRSSVFLFAYQKHLTSRKSEEYHVWEGDTLHAKTLCNTILAEIERAEEVESDKM